MTSKPHISPALFALRNWVTAAAILVAIGSLTQLLIFSIAKFTEARTDQLEGQPNNAIVQPRAAAPPAAPAPADSRETASAQPQKSRPATHGANARLRGEPVDPNTVRSVTDRNMELATAAIGAMGLISLIVLLSTTALGAAVASAGAVPGVEYSVRAFVWTGVILGLCTPWADLAGTTMYDGVFCSYATLTRAADTGGGAANVSHIIVPTVTLVLAGLVAFWFRRGTVAGIILTTLSEVDEALEREMAAIRARGVGRLNPGGRGDVIQQAIAPERVAVPEAPVAASHRVERRSMTDRRVAREVDEEFKRPI